MHILLHKGTPIQTFLTENKIKELLEKNNLVSIRSQEEEISGFEGTDLVRGQNDRYSRKTEFVIKYNPN